MDPRIANLERLSVPELTRRAAEIAKVGPDGRPAPREYIEALESMADVELFTKHPTSEPLTAGMTIFTTRNGRLVRVR